MPSRAVRESGRVSPEVRVTSIAVKSTDSMAFTLMIYERWHRKNSSGGSVVSSVFSVIRMLMLCCLVQMVSFLSRASIYRIRENGIRKVELPESTTRQAPVSSSCSSR